MIKTRYGFKGIILVRGQPFSYECEVVCKNKNEIKNKILDHFKKEYYKQNKIKLNNNERIVVMAKDIKEKERTIDD